MRKVSKTWTWLGVALLFFLAASMLDPWTFHHVQKPNVYDQDWGRALRSIGYWPLWMTLSLGLWLVDRKRGKSSRHAAFLAASVTVGGILAEALKLIVRRERPGTHDGAYGFRPFTDDPFSSRNLGMPSSHAVIAFSGAAALSVLFPEATVVWYALAIGCGVTRILAGAHFLSDVVAGAAIGIGVSILIARRWSIRP